MQVRRAALLALPLLLIGASPAARFIPLPGGDDEGIVMPAASPVQFQRFGEYNRARFRGRFAVEGTFILDCNYCEPGQKDNELHLSLIPARKIVARLPHWKVHDNDMALDITNARPFIRSITTADERRRLLTGKLDEIRGHVTLVVENYEAGLDCDSANYSASFVAVAKPAKRASVKPVGNYGCG